MKEQELLFQTGDDAFAVSALLFTFTPLSKKGGFFTPLFEKIVLEKKIEDLTANSSSPKLKFRSHTFINHPHLLRSLSQKSVRYF